jgi:hypothetical protein
MHNTDGSGGQGGSGASYAVNLSAPAVAANAWYLERINYGYGGSGSVSGTLTVTDGTISEVYPINIGGMQTLAWNPPRKFTTGAALTLTMSAVTGDTASLYPRGWVSF